MLIINWLRADLVALLVLVVLGISNLVTPNEALAGFSGLAVAMILFGCLSMDEAYRSIDWRAIFLIAGTCPFSATIRTSGLSNKLVTGLEQLATSISPLMLVTLLLLVTMLLTNIMAGQAAAPIVLAPIGLAIAKATHTNPRMLLMTIALGCSLAFPTPKDTRST